MFQFVSCHRQAFTLIEVVVVMAIIAIASATALNSLNNARSGRKADQAAEQFASVLRETQNYAVTGRSRGEDNCAYGIDITSDTTYKMIHSFRVAGACTGSGDLFSYTLQNGVRVNPNLATIRYNLPRGTLSATNFSFAFTVGGVTRYVCIYAGGRVAENGSTAC